MARARTDAAERTQQNRRTQEQVAAEVGHPVGVREAIRHRQAKKQEPLEHGFVIRDREVEFDPGDCTRIGQILGRVLDLKVVRGNYVSLSIQASPDFLHTVVDASQVGQGHLLLVTLDELFRPDTEEDS